MVAGRREKNKEEKRQRILEAASTLFAVHGVDEVTTQQIADAADIGAGTLFLYARNKGELLLMVQNANYAQALVAGIAAAAQETEALDAVMAIIVPIVHCNRAHVDNGRTYLREMAFGDPTEEHHARALAIVGDTEQYVAQVLQRTSSCDAATAATLARTASALMLRTMAPPAELSGGVDQIIRSIRDDLSVILPPVGRRPTPS